MCDKFPHQSNGYDCGLFILMLADLLADNLPVDSFSENDLVEYRMKIGNDIIRGNLSY
jgi:Ulp1 family protease